jgi:hypothetical protein
MSVTEIKNGKRDEIKRVLAEVQGAVDKSEVIGDMLIMLKVDGGFVRYSTSIEDTMALVAHLELLKHDVLRRMSS